MWRGTAHRGLSRFREDNRHLDFQLSVSPAYVKVDEKWFSIDNHKFHLSDSCWVRNPQILANDEGCLVRYEKLLPCFPSQQPLNGVFVTKHDGERVRGHLFRSAGRGVTSCTRRRHRPAGAHTAPETLFLVSGGNASLQTHCEAVEEHEGLGRIDQKCHPQP